jgi:3-dehydroquinate synthase
VTLHHSSGHAPVYVEAGLLPRLPALAAHHLPRRKLAVIADDRVARVITIPLDVPILTFPAGEASKNRATWSQLTDQLIALGFGRDSAIVAIGGGVTGDLAGFVAATYLRGVPVLQVPTSLLAMIDASVGGKTAVDTASGKNMVGAYHQPVAVVIDPLLLQSLSEADFRSGLAEAVKHGALLDGAHFSWLSSLVPPILARDPKTMEALIRRSVALKAAIVERDETETGCRVLLNAGHTIAHALEAVTDYTLSHGEAVSIGLVVETALGERLGITTRQSATLVGDLLKQFGLPTTIPRSVSMDRLIELMRSDKKNRAGAVRVALMARIGEPAGNDERGWTTEVGERDLRATAEAYRGT